MARAHPSRAHRGGDVVVRRGTIRLLAAAAVIAAALALAPTGAGAAAPGKAMIRIAHFSPDAAYVDVYVVSLNRNQLFPNVFYKNVSAYWQLNAGHPADRAAAGRPRLHGGRGRPQDQPARGAAERRHGSHRGGTRQGVLHRRGGRPAKGRRGRGRTGALAQALVRRSQHLPGAAGRQAAGGGEALGRRWRPAARQPARARGHGVLGGAARRRRPAARGVRLLRCHRRSQDAGRWHQDRGGWRRPSGGHTPRPPAPGRGTARPRLARHGEPPRRQPGAPSCRARPPALRRPPAMRRHRPVRQVLAAALALALGALLGGCGGHPAAGAGATGPVPVPAATADPAGPRSGGSGMVTPSARPAPAPKPDGFEVASLPSAVRVPGPPTPPLRLSIPAIGVATPLDRLGLAAHGGMEVPGDFARAGWFSAGTMPGQQGPAVIAGHVDSKTGPAVFYRLRELKPGDRVEVERADGVRLRFAVEGQAQYHKASLPTEAVFGPVPVPALRLVTCGGSFDHSRGSYRDNLVVFAHLVGAGR